MRKNLTFFASMQPVTVASNVANVYTLLYSNKVHELWDNADWQRMEVLDKNIDA